MVNKGFRGKVLYKKSNPNHVHRGRGKATGRSNSLAVNFSVQNNQREVTVLNTAFHFKKTQKKATPAEGNYTNFKIQCLAEDDELVDNQPIDDRPSLGQSLGEDMVNFTVSANVDNLPSPTIGIFESDDETESKLQTFERISSPIEKKYPKEKSSQHTTPYKKNKPQSRKELYLSPHSPPCSSKKLYIEERQTNRSQEKSSSISPDRESLLEKEKLRKTEVSQLKTELEKVKAENVLLQRELEEMKQENETTLREKERVIAHLHTEKDYYLTKNEQLFAQVGDLTSRNTHFSKQNEELFSRNDSLAKENIYLAERLEIGRAHV